MDVKVDTVFPLNKQGVDDMSKYEDELNKKDWDRQERKGYAKATTPIPNILGALCVPFAFLAILLAE